MTIKIALIALTVTALLVTTLIAHQSSKNNHTW